MWHIDELSGKGSSGVIHMSNIKIFRPSRKNLNALSEQCRGGFYLGFTCVIPFNWYIQPMVSDETRYLWGQLESEWVQQGHVMCVCMCVCMFVPLEGATRELCSKNYAGDFKLHMFFLVLSVLVSSGVETYVWWL